MRLNFLIFIISCLILVSCKKDDNRINSTCPERLTSIKTNSAIVGISYNLQGLINQISGSKIRYFNNELLAVLTTNSDTIVLDSIGRLLYFKHPFDITGRQTTNYLYDNLNRVVRSVTNTGNGINYYQDLTYNNEDVVDMVYNADNFNNTDHFTYTFYDTICVDPYLSLIYFSQIGVVFNKHLLKSQCYEQDTTFYSYVLDSNNRVLISYRNWNNSGWTYGRAIDTSYYKYSCY